MWVEIEGKRIKKVLNLDEKIIKMLKLMEKNTKNIMCKK
jgi:hypothetical protein